MKSIGQVSFYVPHALLLIVLLITSSGTNASDLVSSLAAGPNSLIECDENTTDIIPTCLLQREVTSSAEELIAVDLKVCACLDKSNHLFNDAASVSKSEAVRIKENKERLIKNEKIKAGNLPILQTSQYSKDKRDSEVVMMAYGAAETRGDLKGTDLPRPELSEELVNIGLIDDENASWQCITYQEFSVQREIPYGKNFFLALKKETFKPEDWNINFLRERYDSATELEKEIIQEKLRFLSRNPVFESIMKARPTERIASETILNKQQELFSILQTLKPAYDSNCTNLPNGCWEEVHSNGAFDNYNDRLSSFIMNNDVIDISSSQASQDYKEELERIMEDSSLNSSIPTDPYGYFNYLQTANTRIANECSGTQADPVCYTMFNQHCSQLRVIDKRVREGLKRNAKDIVDELSEEASIHAAINPNKNPSFRNFNDKICLQPFSNEEGESLNFFQFQTKYCQGLAPLAECSDRKKLLSKYLKEYSQNGELSDLNLRSGFANLINDSHYIDISRAQIEVANNITESPRSLRARFNGDFPTLSDSGVLIPYSAPSTYHSSADSITSSMESPASSEFRALNNSVSDHSSADSYLNKHRSLNRQIANLEKQIDNFDSSLNSRDSYTSSPLSVTSAPVFRGEANMPSAFPPFKPEEEVAQQVPIIESSSLAQISSGTGATNKMRGPASLGNSATPQSSGGVARGSVSAPKEDGSYFPQSNGSGKASSGDSGLFSKYGLNSDGSDQLPEVALVPVSISKINIKLPGKLPSSIMANPNSLELPEEQINLIMSSPGKEVKLLLELDNGEKLQVYARKDEGGGLSFSLNSASDLSSEQKNEETSPIIRINALPEVFDYIVGAPNVFLNQNEVLMAEIHSSFTEGMSLQVVSEERKFVEFDVIKNEDSLYVFKLKD